MMKGARALETAPQKAVAYLDPRRKDLLRLLDGRDFLRRAFLSHRPLRRLLRTGALEVGEKRLVRSFALLHAGHLLLRLRLALRLALARVRGFREPLLHITDFRVEAHLEHLELVAHFHLLLASDRQAVFGLVLQVTQGTEDSAALRLVGGDSRLRLSGAILLLGLEEG